MDPIKLYLREIKDIPLLTAEEEREVAFRIKRGSKAARQKMIKSNLRLVISIAKRYSYLGIPLMDLIEEGNLGLMKAVERYNPSKGYRFSTYAAWWIKQYITRAIANQGKTIRIPVYVVELLLRFKKAQEALSHKLRRIPTIQEIARKMKKSVVKVRRLKDVVTKVSSLHAPIGEDGTGKFMDLIEDESLATSVDELAVFLLRERIASLLEKMNPRERKILVLRYGLKDGVTRTLDETAKKFGITRERVRQIESVAMKKLRLYIKQQEKELVKEMKREKTGRE